MMRQGEVLAGRYELGRLLGRGGMGEVWQGTDRSLRREVAIKLLYLDDAADPAMIARFEREGVAGAQVSHPNVAAVYDHGRDQDLLFLVMEKVDGESLDKVQRREGPMSLPRALGIATAACSGLAAMHDKGVIHQDVKPSNIILTPPGNAKLVDFGIAGFLDTPASLVGSSMLPSAMTVAYAAPEQLLHGRGDERSDLYALGTVLFELLSGRLPFIEPTVPAIMQRKVAEDPPRLDTFVPDVPPAAADLIARLLDRAPGKRPKTAVEVHQQLTEITASPKPTKIAPGPDGTIPLYSPPRTAGPMNAAQPAAKGRLAGRAKRLGCIGVLGVFGLAILAGCGVVTIGLIGEGSVRAAGTGECVEQNSDGWTKEFCLLAFTDRSRYYKVLLRIDATTQPALAEVDPTRLCATEVPAWNQAIDVAHLIPASGTDPDVVLCLRPM